MIPFARLATIVIVVFLLASSASAQIGIGFRAGINISSNLTPPATTNAQEIETDNFTGFVISIPVEFNLSKVLTLQTEINYLKQGYLVTRKAAGISVDFKESYGVLEIPVLAKIGWTNEQISFTVVAGPSVEYVATGRTEGFGYDDGSFVIPAYDEKVDFSTLQSSSFNRTSIYGQAGIQLGVPLTVGKVIFDARYRFALTDQDSRDEFEVKGQGVSTTLGYMVTFGS